MALTERQEIPTRPQESQPWILRKLFSSAGMANLAKVFVNPLEVLLGIVILVACVAELSGRNLSVPFWVLVGSLLSVTVVERYLDKKLKAHDAELKKK